MLPFELPHDALAQALEAGDIRANRGLDWRINRPEQKRAGDPHALEPLAQQARAERVKIELDVGILGHDPSANINTR